MNDIRSKIKDFLERIPTYRQVASGQLVLSNDSNSDWISLEDAHYYIWEIFDTAMGSQEQEEE